jgi:hypothetical protein
MCRDDRQGRHWMGAIHPVLSRRDVSRRDVSCCRRDGDRRGDLYPRDCGPVYQGGCRDAQAGGRRNDLLRLRMTRQTRDDRMKTDDQTMVVRRAA